MSESAVTYDGLPVSAGGAHGLGRISARQAWASWTRFLDACTEAAPIEAWFEFPRTPQLTLDPGVARLIESEFPRGGPPSRRREVPGDRVDDALALFESIEPLPTNRWGMAAVWLWCTAEIRLRRPEGPGVWPGQDPALFGNFVTPTGVRLGTSSTRLVLHARRSLGLALSIPLATDADLARLGPWLEAALPVRLSPNHWSRWTLTGDATSYRGRRIRPL